MFFRILFRIDTSNALLFLEFCLLTIAICQVIKWHTVWDIKTTGQICVRLEAKKVMLFLKRDRKHSRFVAENAKTLTFHRKVLVFDITEIQTITSTSFLSRHWKCVQSVGKRALLPTSHPPVLGGSQHLSYPLSFCHRCISIRAEIWKAHLPRILSMPS